MISESGILTPNTYSFDSINEFYRCKEGIEPTSKTFFSFTEKARLEGFAYVFFMHRLSLNFRGDQTADISDMRPGQNYFPISLTRIRNGNHTLGVSLEDIQRDLKWDEKKEKGQMTLAAARFIFDNKDPSILLLDSYIVHNYKMNIRSFKGHKLDANDGTGFA